jgi:hypothetical protein
MGEGGGQSHRVEEYSLHVSKINIKHLSCLGELEQRTSGKGFFSKKWKISQNQINCKTFFFFVRFEKV